MTIYNGSKRFEVNGSNRALVIGEAFAVEGATCVRIGFHEDKKEKFTFSATLFSGGWTVRKDRKAEMKRVDAATASEALTKHLKAVCFAGHKLENVILQVLCREMKPRKVKDEAQKAAEAQVEQSEVATIGGVDETAQQAAEVEQVASNEAEAGAEVEQGATAEA